MVKPFQKYISYRQILASIEELKKRAERTEEDEASLLELETLQQRIKLACSTNKPRYSVDINETLLIRTTAFKAYIEEFFAAIGLPDAKAKNYFCSKEWEALFACIEEDTPIIEYIETLYRLDY